MGVRAGVLAALAAAVVAEVLLLAVGSLAVLDDVFAVAVVTGNDLSNHSRILPFGLDPLPFSVYIASVDLDRMQREIKPGSDFLIGQPFGDELEHFEFALAERLDQFGIGNSRWR